MFTERLQRALQPRVFLRCHWSRVACAHLLARMQRELLYRVFGAIVTGGAVCQFEDAWQPYLDVAKAFYKVRAGGRAGGRRR